MLVITHFSAFLWALYLWSLHPPAPLSQTIEISFLLICTQPGLLSAEYLWYLSCPWLVFSLHRNYLSTRRHFIHLCTFQFVLFSWVFKNVLSLTFSACISILNQLHSITFILSHHFSLSINLITWSKKVEVDCVPLNYVSLMLWAGTMCIFPADAEYTRSKARY